MPPYPVRVYKPSPVLPYAITGNDGTVKDEAIIDITRSAPQGAHYYHSDVIYLLPEGAYGLH